MKILLVGATNPEISGIHNEEHQLQKLVTGPGMVATVHALTRHLCQNRYDLVVNCGVTGSFDRSIPIGSLVIVENDALSELGAENDNDFLDLAGIGLEGKTYFQSTFPYAGNAFRKVSGITVNTVHGNENSIRKIMDRLHPQVESMEGAAFYFVCEKENIPAIQLRSVSNYVEKRNRDAWNIPLALEKLHSGVNNFLNDLYVIKS